MTRLGDVCEYRNESIAAEAATSMPLYISTDSMMPNRGPIFSSTLPNTGKVKRFQAGDTLVSNIRPYFKKIWRADAEGACSNDVLVFTPTKCLPDYLHWILSSDDFFSFVTKTSKGTKMPRGDKRAIMNYSVQVPSETEQHTICAIMDSLQKKITINGQLNDYLANLCETIASRYCNDRNSRLRDICYQVADHVDYDNANQETYVSTESLMQNKGGRQLASSLPTTGKITRYKAGDTLISNIRPYFKKIWYAPFEGTGSGDVIVFRANDPSNAPYLHACLRQDSFFDYVMQGAKGTKMPRGDKKQMMEFKVASSCSAEDLILLDSVIKQRSDNDSEITKLQKLRDTLLPKLMSGEIDVSKIDLTQLTNNHLAAC